MLFTDDYGRPIHDQASSKLWKEWRKAAGWPQEGIFHSLRHYFATALISANLTRVLLPIISERFASMSTRPGPLLAVRLIGPADVVATQRDQLRQLLAGSLGGQAVCRTSTHPGSYAGEVRVYLTFTRRG